MLNIGKLSFIEHNRVFTENKDLSYANRYQVINSNIKFKYLTFYVWFDETKTQLKKYKHSPLIGIYKYTAYYLLYNGKSISEGNA